jgi:hypothetical protein
MSISSLLWYSLISQPGLVGYVCGGGRSADATLIEKMDHREPTEDVQSLVPVQLIVGFLKGFARPSCRTLDCERKTGHHFARPHG